MERKIAQSNKKLLFALYKSKSTAKKRHKIVSSVELGILRDDFAGEGRKFRNIWALLLHINDLVYEHALGQVRFTLPLPSRTIIMMHEIGRQTFVILTVIQNGKRWTYKIYNNMKDFSQVMGARKLAPTYRNEKEMPMTKILSSQVEANENKHPLIRKAYVKEEYGGIDFEALLSVAKNREERAAVKSVLLKAYEAAKPKLDWPRNYVYNPATKKVAQVDVA